MKFEIFLERRECSNRFKWKQTTIGNFFTVNLLVDSCKMDTDNKPKKLPVHTVFICHHAPKGID